MSGLAASVVMWTVLGATSATPSHGFVADSSHRFELSLTQTTEASPAAGAADQSTEVRAGLRIDIARVDAAGRASGTLRVEGLSVTGARGLVFARLRRVPGGSLTVPLTIEPDGAMILGHTLALALDPVRGHRLLRVPLDAQGLVPAPGSRGLRVHELLSFEARSGRPVGALGPPTDGLGDTALKRDGPVVWLLPTEALALVLLPAERGRSSTLQTTRGALSLIMEAAPAPRARTQVKISVRPRLASGAATQPPPVRMRRDGGPARPSGPSPSRMGARRELSAEVEVLVHTRTGRLARIQAAVDRRDLLDMSATRTSRFELSLRRLE